MALKSRLQSLLWPRWSTLTFPNSNFVRIPANHQLEEETLPDYLASRYYPTEIGQVFQNQYQVVGKFGYGTTSTVWLARDLERRRHVALKVFIKSGCMGPQLENELKMYKRMQRVSTNSEGRAAIRPLLDSFTVDWSQHSHQCLVHPPLWEDVWTFLHRNPIQRLPPLVLAFVLQRVFLALDYLHNECQLIHTDIKADNIMFEAADEVVFREYEEAEMHTPCARKADAEGRTIYASRELERPPQIGAPVLCDFGSVMSGAEERLEDVQPNIYRSPEVILEIPWTYSIDIWNVGCMIWDIFEGGQLFTGIDPELRLYRSRAHLVEMIDLLGPPPPVLLARGNRASEFFSNKGQFLAPELLSKREVPLEERETTLSGRDRELFLRMMGKMLQWEPEKRATAKELANDEWIRKTLRQD